MSERIIKYPRTPHIEGSRLQPGDEDLSQISFSDIAGKEIVVEEKCDGANAAVSFGGDGGLLLQSRGHYLTGGARERHYDLFKRWATVHRDAFHGVLGSRYVMYGEWLYAKHTVFYDALPHYFLEFDVLDRETGAFLDTPSRRALLSGLPVVSAPVIARAAFESLAALIRLVGPSAYIRPGHMERLRATCLRMGEDAERRCAETDPTTTMEGLYLKLEENGAVRARMKYVRASFLQKVEENETHWLNRSIIPNQLERPLEEIFTP
jgi:hypothetical protein